MATIYIGGEREILWGALELEPSPRLNLCGRLDVGPMPSFLAFAPSRRAAYAVVEDGNQLAALSWSESGLSLLSHVTCPGGPAYVAVTSDERNVIAASYGSGQLHAYAVGAHGRLGPATSSLNVGQYAHCVAELPPQVGNTDASATLTDPAPATDVSLTRTSLLVGCKGTDRIALVDINDATKLAPQCEFEAPAGSGPRHIAFSRDGKRAYVASENDCTLLIYKIQGRELTLLEVHSTLPRPFAEGDSGADVHLSPDDRFVYVSNRGHDSIAVFGITTSGAARITCTGSEGATPRNFCLLGNEHLVVANQESCSLSVFERNADSGSLQLMGLVELDQRPFWVGSPTTPGTPR